MTFLYAWCVRQQENVIQTQLLRPAEPNPDNTHFHTPDLGHRLSGTMRIQQPLKLYKLTSDLEIRQLEICNDVYVEARQWDMEGWTSLKLSSKYDMRQWISEQTAYLCLFRFHHNSVMKTKTKQAVHTLQIQDAQWLHYFLQQRY